MNYKLAREIDEYVKNKGYRLINSIVLYKDKELITERYYNKYDENSRNNIKSIWKSILSICVGICLDLGHIKSLDEPISTYLPMFGANNHPYHKYITIHHLLTMTSGIYWNGGVHYHCPMMSQLMRSRDWLSHLVDIQMSEVPGAKYVYKEWDVILLSALISKATGRNTYDFCDQYLYKPLEIVSDPWWTSASGVTYNIADSEAAQAKSDLSARDLAKLGFLFLNGGKYEGRQILSAKYVTQAITPSEQNAGYGLLWWVGDDWYGCRGYGGQEITVIPKQRLVYVIQATATASSKSYGDVFGEILRIISN
ncbi:MAG: serine hydrolase [Herbinix sp.]|jgi:CubicO group peptidase (beta-lactamase class C family)|nr:serine hydrolase [Herbinix sp.]